MKKQNRKLWKLIIAFLTAALTHPSSVVSLYVVGEINRLQIRSIFLISQKTKLNVSFVSSPNNLNEFFLSYFQWKMKKKKE